MSIKILRARSQTIKFGKTLSSVTHSAADDLQSAIWVIVWVALTRLSMKDDLDDLQEWWYKSLRAERDMATILGGKVFIQKDAEEGNIFPQYDTLDKFVKRFLLETHGAKQGSQDQLFRDFYTHAQQIVSGTDTDMDAW